MAATTGVYPVLNNVFKIGADAETATTVADMESFSVAYDNNVEEWTPMEQEGWTRRLMTGKSITVSLSGKRNIGDTGNDYVANMAMKNGRDAEAVLVWEMPNGTKITIPCVINITSGGGDSTNAEALEFDCMSNGKPTVTAAAG